MAERILVVDNHDSFVHTLVGYLHELGATTAMIAGFDDLDWIATAGTRAGLLIASDGRVRRWSGGTRILADGAGLERFGRLPQAASA